VNTTDWLKRLQIAADGTGIVSHARVALIQALSYKPRSDRRAVMGADLAKATGPPAWSTETRMSIPNRA
jgi:hypothetical protein